MFKSILLVLVSMFVLINCGSPTSPDDIDISVSEDMYGVWVNADAPTFMKVCFGRDSSYTLYRNDYAVTRNGTYSPHTKDSLLLEYESLFTNPAWQYDMLYVGYEVVSADTLYIGDNLYVREGK